MDLSKKQSGETPGEPAEPVDPSEPPKPGESPEPPEPSKPEEKPTEPSVSPEVLPEKPRNRHRKPAILRKRQNRKIP